MNYRHRPDGQSWFGSEVSLFIEIELALGLIAASLPDLRGFISRNGFLQSFRHREDSDDVGSVRSPSFAGLESPSDPPRAPSYSIPIIGGVRMGGEGVGWRKKFITPGWLRHDLSLFNTEHSVMTASRRASFEAAKLEDIEASGESSDSANESSEPSPQEGETSREGEKTQHAPG